MLAVHARVHHEFSVERCGLPGLERRRTDDGAGRSAALYDAYGRGCIERERSVAAVLDSEFSAHHLVERLTPQVKTLLIHFKPRSDLAGAAFG